ncbi:FecR family protein [Aquimarina agarilytica]|uniref:FecR family protein n=1 Tax=Aquimarina agarilytica TaxID=1087449 RepID=UPI000289EB7E|nr:FecR family protein [Aquimarina agarilytica]
MSDYINKNNFLARWLEDDLTAEEKKAFEKSDDFSAYSEILNAVERFEKPEFNLDHELIQQKEYNKNYTKKNTKVIKLRPWIYAAAASVALLMFIGLKMFSPANIVINASLAEKTTHELPDHSMVTLNAESSIKYDKDTFLKKRTLKLTGQAFFEVAKGSTFTVNTNKGAISVLGTQFDVFSRNNQLKVRCFEGKVQVKNTAEAVILTKGKAVKINEQNTFTPYTITDNKPEWTQGYSAFNKATLNEVIESLERQYDVKINSKHINTKRTFTGFFTHKNLENAIKTCFEPLHIKYTFASANEIVLKE